MAIELCFLSKASAVMIVMLLHVPDPGCLLVRGYRGGPFFVDACGPPYWDTSYCCHRVYTLRHPYDLGDAL